MKDVKNITVKDVLEYLEIVLDKDDFNKIKDNVEDSLLVEETMKLMQDIKEFIFSDSDYKDVALFIWFLDNKGYGILDDIEKEIMGR